MFSQGKRTGILPWYREQKSCSRRFHAACKRATFPIVLSMGASESRMRNRPSGTQSEEKEPTF